MAGVILLLLGVARLGAVIKFIPDPVIAGFTAGIGVIIWAGQWKDFFGLPPVARAHFHEKMWRSIQAFPALQCATTAIGSARAARCGRARRGLPGLKRVPGAAVRPRSRDAASRRPSNFRASPRSAPRSAAFRATLPRCTFPDVTLRGCFELIGPAFAIAMLGAIESLLSAVVADGMTGTRHDSNQELIGGIANMLAPLFGGFAATGAIARTATNIRNGGTSPVAGIVHAISLVLVIWCSRRWRCTIPLAALAAILF